jgi:hypothetical protein
MFRVPHGTLNTSLAFEASTDPVDISAQAALAPHQKMHALAPHHMEQEESADTSFMVMRHVHH